MHAAKFQVFCLHAVFPSHKFVHVYLPKEVLVQCICYHFFYLTIDFYFKVPVHCFETEVQVIFFWRESSIQM